MGLAAKLAAAQGSATPIANYSSQQPGGGAPGAAGQRTGGGSYPGQPQYQAYPGANQMAGANGAPPYPSTLQPGYPQSNPGYPSPAPGGYSSPQPSYSQQQYSRPAPPPPGSPQYGGYGAQSPYAPNQPPYGQNQPHYGGQSYQQGPQGGYGYGYGQGYGGPPPPQYGGPGQQQGGPPGQQPQYGAPPQGQPQYGAPPPAGGAPAGRMDVSGYQRALESAIREKHLEAFYGPGSAGQQKLPYIAQRAEQQVQRLSSAWNIQREVANDIVRLALYDVVIYIDDSGSMEFEENGSRIDDLRLILKRVAFAATLFDDDGIELRAMNADLERELGHQAVSGITSEQQVEGVMSRMRYKGLTPFGRQLQERVINPILLPKLRSNMQKPLLIICITDGSPTGESSHDLLNTVKTASQEAGRSRYGRGAVAFQFAQVGNDRKATEFLAQIDNDATVGDFVDCTSNYENESAEMARASPPVNLTPDLWILKLILGAIDPSYDTKDEASSRPQPGYGGQQGGPPQYGAPGGQPHYGQGPPGGYGQQGPGYGPPGGQQQYNRPPPGPPQGQYPGQGYGGPPQPPRY